jgi:hypothetical protein
MELNKIITTIYIGIKQTKEKEKKNIKFFFLKLILQKKSWYLLLRKAPISKPQLAKRKGKGSTSFNNTMRSHINNSNKSAKEGTPTTHNMK